MTAYDCLARCAAVCVHRTAVCAHDQGEWGPSPINRLIRSPLVHCTPRWYNTATRRRHAAVANSAVHVPVATCTRVWECEGVHCHHSRSSRGCRWRRVRDICTTVWRITTDSDTYRAKKYSSVSCTYAWHRDSRTLCVLFMNWPNQICVIVVKDINASKIN